MEFTNKIDRFSTKKLPMIYTVATILVLLFTAGACAEGAGEYVLQPGDVIQVSVVEHPEFSGRHKIRPDGRINYPVIGEMDVASLTCAQLVKIMENKLVSYVNNPVVSVSIEAYYANKIFVIGEVNRAGEFEIYEPIDIIKALAMAGGVKNAGSKTAKIIRTDGSMVTVSLQDLWSGKLSKRESSKYLLYPGDTVFVPDSFKMPWTILGVFLTTVLLSLQIVWYTQTLKH